MGLAGWSGFPGAVPDSLPFHAGRLKHLRLCSILRFQMQRIKAIETKYKGYRFRSRLEARWAVFFETFGIPWEYEIEGFQLPSGATYLPDFYLPSIDVFVEVKPVTGIPFDDIKRLLDFGAEKNLLLIIGTPMKQEMLLIPKGMAQRDDIDEEWIGDKEYFGDRFWIIDGLGEYPLHEAMVDRVLDMLRLFGSVAFAHTPFDDVFDTSKWTLVFTRLTPNDEHHLSGALLKANQSRFEFGEKG